MAQTHVVVSGRRAPAATRRQIILSRQGPAFQAFSVLYAGFIVLPIVAGLDKFSHLLVDWNVYLSPLAASLVGGRVDAFMQAAGAIEICAGLLVATKPSIGGWVVAAWLMGIIANLLMIPSYFDVALRDFGLALGAVALARLARAYGR